MINFKTFLNEERLDEHIINLPNGKWQLVSKSSGKNLGTFDSREAAVKHEQEIEYFKNEDRTADVYAHNFITDRDDRLDINSMNTFDDIREKEKKGDK